MLCCHTAEMDTRNTLRASAPGRVRPLSVVVRENIRAEAARAGLSGKDVARIVGLSAMAIYDRNNGRTAWQLDELQVIALRLGVPPGDLVVDHSASRSTAGISA